MTKKDAILALASIRVPIRMIAEVVSASANQVSVVIYQSKSSSSAVPKNRTGKSDGVATSAVGVEES
jgi:hypothetical protein